MHMKYTETQFPKEKNLAGIIDSFQFIIRKF